MSNRMSMSAGVMLSLGLIFSLSAFGSNHALSKEKNIQFAEKLVTPYPYTVKGYVTGLDGPRFMVVTSAGDLIVSQPSQGNMLLIPYNQPNKKIVLLSSLNSAHSMDIYKGYLYVAEEHAVGRIKFEAKNRRVVGKYKRLFKNLPADGGHWTRTIKFGPDGYGYVSIGSSCNVCTEENPLRATITWFKPGDNQLEVYASGLRNSVGFDWSPITERMYATENGRDLLGDNFPPDELNQIKLHKFYGWPYAHGDRVPDPDFGKGHENEIKNSIRPAFKFHAHVAPLGLMFFKNPESPLYGKALVALHGSWNSSVPVGYKVRLLTFKKNEISVKDFLTGFIVDGNVQVRPVHMVEGKHGELYLSSDYNGSIYVLEPK